MLKHTKKFWRRKSIVVALGLALILAASGCGSSTTTESTTVEKKPVLIGVSMSMSGAIGPMSISFDKSIDMAIEELNATSKKFVFSKEVLDDQGTVPNMSANIDRLVAKTKFIIAAQTAAQGQPAAKMAVDNKILMMAPTQTDPIAFTAAPNNMFGGVGPADKQGIAVANFIATKGYKKVAMLVPKTQYGKDAGAAATEVFKSKGINIVYSDEIANGATDVRAYVSKVKESGADVVFTFNYSDVSAAIAKALAEINYKVAITGGSAFQSEAYLTLAGATAEGTVAFTEAPADNWQKGTEWNATFLKKFNEKPYSPYANFAVYDVTMMLGLAIEKAGADDVGKVVDALRTITFDGAGGPGLKYNGNTMTKVPGFMEVKGGKWVRAS